MCLWTDWKIYDTMMMMMMMMMMYISFISLFILIISFVLLLLETQRRKRCILQHLPCFHPLAHYEQCQHRGPSLLNSSHKCLKRCAGQHQPACFGFFLETILKLILESVHTCLCEFNQQQVYRNTVLLKLPSKSCCKQPNVPSQFSFRHFVG